MPPPLGRMDPHLRGVRPSRGDERKEVQSGQCGLNDTHTFEHERQLRISVLPSQSEFFVISKHFTATPRIPPTSTVLKTASFNCNFTVEPQTFTTDLTIHLRSL